VAIQVAVLVAIQVAVAARQPTQAAYHRTELCPRS